ncbi:Uncharacterized protein QTN25_003047 [Entamoeba marina]
MSLTLPTDLISILPNYTNAIVNCTKPSLRSLASKVHMSLLPIISTTAILHTPYQTCSPHAFQQFTKNDKTLVIQVGGICSKHSDVYLFPIDVPLVKSLSFNNDCILVVDPALVQRFSFMHMLPRDYLVIDMKDAFVVRNKAIENNINKVVILQATDHFNPLPYQLYFSPLSISLQNVTTGDITDVTNTTLRQVMNRYAIFDTIRRAERIMLLLLDPDWYTSPYFAILQNIIKTEFKVITVFMGTPQNKLLNYHGEVDIVVALGCDCSDLKMEGGIPVVTPFEILYAICLQDEIEWNGEYPIGLERTQKFIEIAKNLVL